MCKIMYRPDGADFWQAVQFANWAPIIARSRFHEHEMLAGVDVGHSRPFWSVLVTSALPPIATEQQTFRDVGFVP